MKCGNPVCFVCKDPASAPPTPIKKKKKRSPTDKTGRKGRQRKARRKRTIAEFIKRFGKLFCIYCEVDLDSVSATIEHIVSMANGGSHEQHNLTIACADCNNKADNGERRRKWKEKKLKERGLI